eukprot:12802777-Alexandrium_andersonii.AAC.1
MSNLQNSVKRSVLELRGPETASHWVPKAPEGCILCHALAENPNLLMNTWIDGGKAAKTPSRELPIQNPPIRT